MTIHIVGSFNKDQIYCAGSVTKLLTTYVALSFLAEKYEHKKFIIILLSIIMTLKITFIFQKIIKENISA